MFLVCVLSIVSSVSAQALKVDFAYDRNHFGEAEAQARYEATAKNGWIHWEQNWLADLWTHDPRTLSNAGGTGVDITVGCGYAGDTSMKVLGMHPEGDGAVASGMPEGDPICNSYIMSGRHWGNNPDWGSILLTFRGLEAGTYELKSYHSDAANPDVYLGYRLSRTEPPYDIMPAVYVYGDAVSLIEGAAPVAIQHVTSDAELTPSVVKFEYWGVGDVVVKYMSPPGDDRCVGGAAVLNAFELIPEPATMVLLGLGSLALLRRKR
jgi:hypothetical protein